MDQHVINQAKLESFVMRAIGDVTAGYMGVMVSLGSKLGLYKALAGAGPLSSKEVAKRAGCAERYVREWLNAQAAGGYLSYHAVERHLRTPARAGDGAGRRGQPGLHPACLERAGFDVVRRGEGPQRLPHRQGNCLGRTRRQAGLRRGLVLPERLPRQPRVGVAAGAGRRGGAARKPASTWPTWAAAMAIQRC